LRPQDESWAAAIIARASDQSVEPTAGKEIAP
jgi:hypothetical protein